MMNRSRIFLLADTVYLSVISRRGVLSSSVKRVDKAKLIIIVVRLATKGASHSSGVPSGIVVGVVDDAVPTASIHTSRAMMTTTGTAPGGPASGCRNDLRVLA